MERYNTVFTIFASIFFTFFTKVVYAKNEVFLCSKSQNVNARNGPSTQFSVIYKITKQGYPVKVIEKVDHWYAVEDYKKDKMWISSSNLSAKCGKIVKMGHNAEVKIKPDISSNTLFILEEGFVIEKIKCYTTWCNVKIENQSGWVLEKDLWR